VTISISCRYIWDLQEKIRAIENIDEPDPSGAIEDGRNNIHMTRKTRHEKGYKH
jgi:hypothetical protein